MMCCQVVLWAQVMAMSLALQLISLAVMYGAVASKLYHENNTVILTY